MLFRYRPRFIRIVCVFYEFSAFCQFCHSQCNAPCWFSSTTHCNASTTRCGRRPRELQIICPPLVNNSSASPESVKSPNTNVLNGRAILVWRHCEFWRYDTQDYLLIRRMNCFSNPKLPLAQQLVANCSGNTNGGSHLCLSSIRRWTSATSTLEVSSLCDDSLAGNNLRTIGRTQSL